MTDRYEEARLTPVFLEVSEERSRQDGKWGGPDVDDARKTPEDWCEDIIAYATWAKQMSRCGSADKYRRRMMQVAALAVAACESFDRITSAEIRHNWVCVSQGLYDSTYSCVRCGKRHTECADNPDTSLPAFGCEEGP